MDKNEQETNSESCCNLTYLTELMGGKREPIIEIMDVFLTEIPDGLQSLKDALEKRDYARIKVLAHTLKSSVSIMGISILTPILQEMENLGERADSLTMERLEELNMVLNLTCKKAIVEIENDKANLK